MTKDLEAFLGSAVSAVREGQSYVTADREDPSTRCVGSG